MSKRIFLVVLLLALCHSRMVIGQLVAESTQDGSLYGLESLKQLEDILDSCNTQGGIGSALNYLSQGFWALDGGGRNISGGDSLHFRLDVDGKDVLHKNRFHAWVFCNKYEAFYEAANIEVEIFQYSFQFLFPDKRNLEYVIKAATNSGYKKTKDEYFENYTVSRYEKDNYVIEITTINKVNETVYLFDVFFKY